MANKREVGNFIDKYLRMKVKWGNFMKFNTTGKVILSVALILVSFGISSLISLYNYGDLKDSGKLQAQLTRKIAQVSGVWLSVKVASGVISFLQEIQVEASVGFVVGGAVSVQPLGWTEVVDNTLDQISDICLWAMAALAIEKVLLAISVWVSLRIILPVCAILIVIAVWSKKYSGQLKRVIAGIAIISLGICLAIPLALELSNVVETSILAGQIEETVEEMSESSGEIEKSGNEANDINFLRRMISGISSFFSGIKNHFDSLIDRAINYIILFIVTNILIPIGTLFGLKYFISTVLSFIGFTVKSKKTP